MSVYTNRFYSGLKILLNKEPCLVLGTELVKPGKGHGFYRLQIRNLISNKLLEKTLKTTEYLELADVFDFNLTYLYSDTIYWYFINNKDFEQFCFDISVVKDNKKWLTKQLDCVVTMWKGKAIMITPPLFVYLKVVDTEPFFKCKCINNKWKYAKLITGIVVKVPLFIKTGEKIKIDTRNGEYVSRK